MQKSTTNKRNKMNQIDTPTPRTDEQINGKPCTRFEVLGGDSLRDAYVPSNFARTLERELTAVTEQRDRLAEDLKQIYNVSLFDYDTMPEAARKKYREVVFAIADKALQSLNQPTEP
jgi:hypothetical protein